MTIYQMTILVELFDYMEREVIRMVDVLTAVRDALLVEEHNE